MKKIIAISLTLIMLLSISVVALGNEVSNSLNAGETTMNEYEMLKSLSKKSNSELAKLGYNSEEVEKVRNYKEEYVKHLKKYATLEDKNLYNLGYTSEQIKMLRSYDGSEEQTIALSASLVLNLTADYVTWSASENRTNARLVYDFAWSGVPLIKTTDVVAVSWDVWQINGKHAYTTYKHIYGTEPDIYGYPTFVENDGPNSFGAGYKFPMTQQDNYYWAQSGEGIFTLYHNNSRWDLSAYAEYGHSTITVSPSFSIPGYGSISFIPNSVTTADTAHEDKECEN